MICKAEYENQVAIVIPTYTRTLTTNEQISLAQCRKVLGSFDCYFLAPKELEMDYVEEEAIVRIDGKNLVSRKSYSDYMLSIEFYEKFEKYEYILIYQLDAFVFENRLLDFCNLGYDYIGAPWIHGLECHVKGKQLLYMGNGGLSLRRVSAFLDWLHSCQDEVDTYKVFMLEDMLIAALGETKLKLAPMDVAMDFSFDVHPSECYKLHGNILPFGCHAWHKFEPEFWAEQIGRFGYEVKISEKEDEEAALLSTAESRAKLLRQHFQKEKIDPSLRKLIQNYDGRIYVYCAGQYGISFINMVQGTGIIIEGIIDGDPQKQGKRYLGLEIKSFDEITDKMKIPILVATQNPEPIEQILTEAGLKKGVHYTLSKELQKQMMGDAQ